MRKPNPAYLVAVAAVGAGISLASMEPLTAPRSTSGLNLAAIDKSVRPGDDFFDYAVGRWYAHAEIPPDRSEIGLEQETSEKVDQRLRILIERCARHPSDANDSRIASLYNSYMDEPRLEDLDDRPLRNNLAAIAAVHDFPQFARLLGESWSGLGGDVFTLLIQPDAHRPVNILTIGQGGLGLPDRDYYLAPAFASQRHAYEAYVTRTLRMISTPTPEDSAKAILAFETRIAGASWAQSKRREIDKTYNPMSFTELQTYAPGIDWRAYMEGAKVPNLDRVVLT